MKSESSAASWLKFFTAAGVNVEYAEHYAVTFSKNQIQLDMLPEINKDYLNDMGINLLGHVIAILRHAKMVYADEIKKSELPSMKTPISKATKEVKVAKPAAPVKTITGKSTKQNEDYEKPSSSVKRKSTVVQLPTSEGCESKPKVMKKLCDSSDDVTFPVVKPTNIRVNQETTANDEARKGVFKRLGVEVTLPSDDVESTAQQNNINVNGVFSRLGEKADSVSQVVKVVAKPVPAPNYSSSKETRSPEVSKPVLKKSIIRTRLDKSLVQRVNKFQQSSFPLTYMDRELLKSEGRQASKLTSSNSTLLIDNRDIKSRLGMPSSKTNSSQGSGNIKKVSFGPVSHKLIPKVNKLTTMSRQKLASQSFTSNFTSNNRPSGVFSRLGMVPF